MDIFFDRIHVFHIFFDRVGVIEAQVALAAKCFGRAEIDADGFGVADMQVTVRFGGKRVWTWSNRPVRRSSSIASRMKLLDVGEKVIGHEQLLLYKIDKAPC